MRSENQRMQEWLRSHGIRARVKRIWDGSLKNTWRLYEPSTRWSQELADKLMELGFRNFEGRPLGPYSGNGGVLSVFVRGHDEMVEDSMNRTSAARELLVLAKSLLSMEFGTKEEMEQYKKDHDVRPGTRLTVEKQETKAPAKGKPIPREKEDQISTNIRDILHGTERVTTKENMMKIFKKHHSLLHGVSESQFGKIWDSMVDEGYLKKSGSGYRWNNEGTFDNVD